MPISRPLLQKIIYELLKSFKIINLKAYNDSQKTFWKQKIGILENFGYKILETFVLWKYVVYNMIFQLEL